MLNALVRFSKSKKIQLAIGALLALFFLSAATIAIVAPEKYICYRMIAGGLIGIMCFILGIVMILEELQGNH